MNPSHWSDLDPAPTPAGARRRVDPATAPSALVAASRSLAVLASYYLAARLGLLIPWLGTHISLVWLPTGIALAAFRRWGPAMAPAVFIAAMAANASIGGPLWVAAVVGVGNTAGTGLSAWVLSRWGFENRLLRRQDMVTLLLAIGAGMVVTATNGVGWLRIAGAPDTASFAGAWLSWFVGDAVGALLAAVPLLAWTAAGARQSFLGAHGAANSVLQAVVAGCGLLVFSAWLAPGSALLFPLLALPFFVIALLALRGGVLASSTGVLLLSLAAAYGTARGHGPFAGQDAHAGVLALWSYITAQACTSLLICGIGTELQSSRRQFSALMRHAHDAILVIDDEGTVSVANAAAAAMLGIAGGSGPADADRTLASIPRGNGALLAPLLAGDAAVPARALTLVGEDGAALHVDCQVARYVDGSGHWQTQLNLRDVTRRQHAEARLKALTDNLPALFAFVDRDQVYRFANAHFRKVMGIAPEALVGQSMRQFLGAEAHAALLPHIQGALRGERQKFERTGWQHNAHTHFLVEYVPEFGDDGGVRGFLIMVLDITERHDAELALARSEQRIRTITDNVPALIAHIDRDYRYTFANAHYATWFALPASPVGKTVAEVFGERVFANVRGHMDTALAGEDIVFDLENTVPGAPPHLQVHYLPDRDEAGRVTGIYGLVMDRTEQHLARELIAASERQLRAVTDNLPVLITYVDADERLQYMNKTFHDWLGVDLAASVGRKLADVVGPEHYAKRRTQLHAALAGERVEFEVVSTTLGGVRHLQTVYVPDRRADGVVRGIFTLATDVTALKTVEFQLQQLARIDVLTGLANRRQFNELLDQSIARCDRTGRALALIYLDVDRFKSINDGHGHAAGDLVLKEFASRLQHAIRVTDTAARLSGDEFVVILDGLAAIDEAEAVAAKLVAAVRVPMALADGELPVTASLGLAFRPAGAAGIGAEELLARADRALYAAKAAGRDRYCVDRG